MIYESSPVAVKAMVNAVYLFAGVGLGTIATKLVNLIG